MIGSPEKEMFKSANLEGNFSNHNLRASSAIRMFENSVPK